MQNIHLDHSNLKEDLKVWNGDVSFHCAQILFLKGFHPLLRTLLCFSGILFHLRFSCEIFRTTKGPSSDHSRNSCNLLDSKAVMRWDKDIFWGYDLWIQVVCFKADMLTKEGHRGSGAFLMCPFLWVNLSNTFKQTCQSN